MSDAAAYARLEALKSDAGFPRVVFHRLTDGESRETLRAIARSLQIPRGPFVEWFVTEHASLYDAALKVLAAEYGEEAVAIADEASPDTVQVKRLQAETRLKVAGKWDRTRYGEQDSTPRGPAVVIQVANLRALPESVVTTPALEAVPALEPAEAAL